MVVNPEDRSSRIEAQIISMRQFHFPQIDIFFLLNNMSSDQVCLNVTSIAGMCCYIIHSDTDILVLPVPIQPKTFRFPQRSFDFKKHEQRKV